MRTEAQRIAELERAVLAMGRELAEVRQDHGVMGLRHPRMAAIIAACADAFGVPMGGMLSLRRAQGLANARFAACALARELTVLSLPQIGRAMGGRDHTTILHATRQADVLRRLNPNFAARLATARAALTQEGEPA